MKEDQTHQSVTPPAVLKWISGIILLVIVGAYLYQVIHYWHQINDDAFITFRYSRFLSTGHGPYFNPAQHVEGYTNFSLMLLMSLVFSLFGESAVPLAAKGLGATCGVLSILICFFLVKRLLHEHLPFSLTAVWSLAAAGFIAADPGYAINSTSGLETTMFGLFLLAAVVLATKETTRQKWLGSGLVFGAAALTRPEGFVLFAVFWLANASGVILHLIRDLKHSRPATLAKVVFASKIFRILVVNGAILTAVLVSQLIFRLLAYDGEWLPNTYYAKSGGFWSAPWPYVSSGILAPFFGIVGIALAVAGLFLDGVPRAFIPIAAIAFAGAGLPFITGTDWMLGYRLVVPYLPLMACVVVVGWSLLLLKIAGLKPWLPMCLVPLALLAMWTLREDLRKNFYQKSIIRSIGYKTGHVVLAKHLCDGVAKKDDTIALMDIGIIGYLCHEQRILDISGLTDRTIAKSPGLFLNKSYDPGYVLSQKPEFIVLVITAAGTPYKTPRPNTRFDFWTKMEKKIYNHPEFQKHYVRRYSLPDKRSMPDWTYRLAGKLGAEKIFQHAHPGRHYLLALFRYQSADSQTAAASHSAPVTEPDR
ncbi:MAG: hypothetical protein JRJ87_02345 [Deltaproteobacteria bacterium]|nr:hypothetical protein [Deltaproteobacteria bacterium]